MVRMVVFSVAAVAAVSCGGSGPEQSTPGPSCGVCSVSSQCALGELCVGGCCEAASDPLAQCAQDPSRCVDLDALCATTGCECRLVVSGRDAATLEDPTLAIPASGHDVIEAILSVTGGETVGKAAAIYELDGPGFAVDGGAVSAGPDPAVSRLTARFGDAASCDATLINLGPKAPDGVRLFVFDAASGAPIAGAQVVVDTDDDGLDDAGANDTGSNGTTSYDIDAEYDVTIFATGYGVVGLAGVDASLREIAAPLSAVHAVGAAEGRVDFDRYVDLVRGGQAGSIGLAMVSLSFPIQSLMHFDLGLLLGGALADNDCSGGGPGCYHLQIPGLFDETVQTWGGVVLTLPSAPLKDFFEVVGRPGHRTVWGLGGQWEAGELTAMFDEVLLASETFCQCDATASCDGSCECDADCSGALESRLLRNIVPLLVDSASGQRGNVRLSATTELEWQSHIADDYAEGRAPDDRFARLDDGRDGPLSLSARLSQYIDVIAPALPDDPVLPGRPLDSVTVLTGVEVPGAGFVPLGLGAGFDCTGPHCSGHRASDGSGYDGVIDGQQICRWDPRPLFNGCPDGIPSTSPDGHVGVLYAEAPAELRDYRLRTVVMALPLDSFDRDRMRGAGLILEGTGEGGRFALGDAQYPSFSALPEVVQERTLTMPASAGAVLRARVADWTVFAGPGTQTYVAPVPPLGFSDPFAVNESVAAECAVMDLGGVDYPAALGHGGAGLAHLDANLAGFAVVRRRVEIKP